LALRASADADTGVLKSLETWMTEYTLHFQKGSRIGARSLRMIHINCATPEQAIKIANGKAKSCDLLKGYKLVRVDHYDEETGRMVRA
jgi:hypothetical protein